MNLAFSTHWPEKMPAHLRGSQTYFIDKIWNSLKHPLIFEIHDQWSNYKNEHYKKFGQVKTAINFDFDPNIQMKLHTIRRDDFDRWKAGNDIHFIINSRSSDRFQFAPVTKCTSLQKIEISWSLGPNLKTARIRIDGVLMNSIQMEQLAKNDGFKSLEDFFSWFNEDFTGKIIHWTDKKYTKSDQS